MLGLVDPSEEHARSPSLGGEALDCRRDLLLVEVVGEHDDDRIAADELFGETERLGDAAGALLIGVEEALDSPFVSVAKKPKELSCVCSTRDEHELSNACFNQRLDRPEDHGPVVDRKQVFVRDPREGIKSATCATREDDPLHGVSVIAMRSLEPE